MPGNSTFSILGGGNAGIGAAVPARAAGLSVGMVERRDMGGTCPNRGCTPKKVLVAAAHALHEIEQAKFIASQLASPARLGRADRPREGTDQRRACQPDAAPWKSAA